MKLSLLSVIILLGWFANASQNQTIGMAVSKQPQVMVGQSATGELTYMVPGPDGKLRTVSMSFFTSNLEKAIESAKKVVCEMSVLPQSVTISSVVVSVTYETKQFCSAKKE